MATHPDYPLAAEKYDRHDKLRWRFTRGARPMLPGQPGEAAFVAAYAALCEGRPVASSEQAPTRSSAEVIRLHPRSMRAAYDALRKDPTKWGALEANTRKMYADVIERMLNTVVEGSTPPRRFGDGPLAELQRCHCVQLLNLWAATPWMQVVAKVCLSKLIMVGIDANPQWFQHDPMYKLKMGIAPRGGFGYRAWRQEQLDAFERRWPIGTRARLAYALGLWLGDRVSDVCALDWSMLKVEEMMVDGSFIRVWGFDFQQFKGRKFKQGEMMFLPITPMLARELQWEEGQERSGRVLTKERGAGGYDVKSVSNMMSKKWSRRAGLPVGYSMHGLRKALAIKLAYADATTREIMMWTGHKDIVQIEVYTRQAEQARMAVKAGLKLTKFEDERRAAEEQRRAAEVGRRRAKLKLVS